MKTKLLVHPEELSKKLIDRFKKTGLTTIGIHPVGGAVSHESLENMLTLSKDEKFTSLIDYIYECGMNVEYEMHASSFLLPRALFSSNPEYFRMDENGNRCKDSNFCISNSDALNIFTENAVKLAKSLYRSTNNFFIWLDDVENSGCKCEKCSKLSPSTQLLTVMNATVTALRKEIPDATLSYLAYHDTLTLPDVTPAEGIFLEYAPFKRDFTKGASDMPEEEITKIYNLLKFFGKENARVLEYWYDNSLFSNWTKPPKKLVVNGDVIKNDLLFYKKLGFPYVSSFACYLGEDYDKLWGEMDFSDFTYKGHTL